MPLLSFVFSIFIHLCVALVIIFMPKNQLNIIEPKEVYQVSLVMGAPGGENMPSPVLGIRTPASPAATNPNPSLATNVPKEISTPKPEVPKAPTEIPKPEMTPEIKPEVKATPQPNSQKQDIPEPVKNTVPDNAVAISTKPAEEKKKPEEKEAPKEKEPEKPKETPKDVPKEQPKAPETPKETPKAPEPPKEAPKPSNADILANALADANKEVKKNPGTANTNTRTANNRANTLASALSDMKNQAADQGGGGGGQGEGPGGGGIYDVYAAQVILAVRPNWGYASALRDNIVVQVAVQIDPTGKVLDCRVEKSSGRPDFDASAVNAVIRTQQLPPPPTPDQQNLVITFNSSELR